MLQDTHIHIQDLKPESLIPPFLSFLRSSGPVRFFNCAITPADWSRVLFLAGSDPHIVPFLGIHPWFSDSVSDQDWEALERHLSSSSRIFCGEMGLDKSRKNIGMDVQKEVFVRQIRLAKKYDRPFAVHCVRAWSDVIPLIREHASGVRFLMHCFQGSREIAEEVLGMGGFLSLSVRDFLKGEAGFRDLVRGVPLEKVLIETDFPYQVKPGSPGDYGESLRRGYEVLAGWRGLSFEDTLAEIIKNGSVFTD
ncbi:MAG: TatD family hydrolase [Elusimicrobia bacterium]|nr:TatD family hydrolase [Elusimicrobiota bacterium]